MRLVILDRDGVINKDSNDHIRHHAHFHPIEGSIEAIAELHKKGFTVVIATNQSGIARGYFTLEDLQFMHDKLIQLVEKAGGGIAGIYFCPHHPDEDCDCRKPKTGLLEQIAKDFPQCNLKNAFLVGDSWRDIAAGKQMGCQTFLVQTGKGLVAYAAHHHELGNTIVVKDLAEAALKIKEIL